MRASILIAAFAALTTAQVAQPDESSVSNGSGLDDTNVQDSGDGSAATTDNSDSILSAAAASYAAAASTLDAASSSLGDAIDATITTTTAAATSSPIAGYTASDGSYVCNPAHSYAPGITCDDSGPTPTLAAVSTDAAASTTLSSWSGWTTSTSTSVSTIPVTWSVWVSSATTTTSISTIPTTWSGWTSSTSQSASYSMASWSSVAGASTTPGSPIATFTGAAATTGLGWTEMVTAGMLSFIAAVAQL